MRVFIDTSAILALLVRSDTHHSSAINTWDRMIDKEAMGLSHNYVAVETMSLLQNRFGMDVVERFTEKIVPAIRFEWIDRSLHQSALTQHVRDSNRQISFVDRISFHFMQEHSLNTAFVFDQDFEREGFDVL